MHVDYEKLARQVCGVMGWEFVGMDATSNPNFRHKVKGRDHPGIYCDLLHDTDAALDLLETEPKRDLRSLRKGSGEFYFASIDAESQGNFIAFGPTRAVAIVKAWLISRGVTDVD